MTSCAHFAAGRRHDLHLWRPKIFEEALTLPRADRLYLTHVHAHLEGDRYFPDWRTAFPTIISQREAADENFRYTFNVLGR